MRQSEAPRGESRSQRRCGGISGIGRMRSPAAWGWGCWARRRGPKEQRPCLHLLPTRSPSYGPGFCGRWVPGALSAAPPPATAAGAARLREEEAAASRAGAQGAGEARQGAGALGGARGATRSAWFPRRGACAPPLGGRGEPSPGLAGGRGAWYPRFVEGRSEGPSCRRSPPQLGQPPEHRIPLPDWGWARGDGAGETQKRRPWLRFIQDGPQCGSAHPQPGHRTVSRSALGDTGQTA